MHASSAFTTQPQTTHWPGRDGRCGPRCPFFLYPHERLTHHLGPADYRETAAKFQKEWRVQQPHRHFDFAPHVKNYALVDVLNKGLVYQGLERDYANSQVRSCRFPTCQIVTHCLLCLCLPLDPRCISSPGLALALFHSASRSVAPRRPVTPSPSGIGTAAPSPSVSGQATFQWQP